MAIHEIHNNENKTGNAILKDNINAKESEIRIKGHSNDQYHESNDYIQLNTEKKQGSVTKEVITRSNSHDQPMPFVSAYKNSEELLL